MKFVYWVLGILVGIVVLFGVIQTVASERIEVVELATLDEAGAEQITRLWVVDDDGFAYLRVGADGSGWFSRLQDNGEIQVTRNDEPKRYTTVLRHDKSGRINTLMQEKYTWGDTFFATMFGSRDGSIPVELHLATSTD